MTSEELDEEIWRTALEQNNGDKVGAVCTLLCGVFVIEQIIKEIIEKKQ